MSGDAVGEARIEAHGVVRGPDGQVKCEIVLRGVTAASEAVVRETLGLPPLAGDSTDSNDKE